MTSTKFQINYPESFRDSKIQWPKHFRSSITHTGGQVLIIDISNLFVICFLLFGALIKNLFDFMGKH